jgi:hypothetical protein
MIGKSVEKIFVRADQEMIKFQFADGETGYFITDADCCSETWFADIIGVKALLSGKIKKTEYKDLDCPQDDRCRQDEDQFYSIEITTEKGVCVFAFRNSSNGYYGGSCSYVSEATDINCDWTEVTGDYSA